MSRKGNGLPPVDAERVWEKVKEIGANRMYALHARDGWPRGMGWVVWAAICEHDLGRVPDCADNPVRSRYLVRDRNEQIYATTKGLPRFAARHFEVSELDMRGWYADMVAALVGSWPEFRGELASMGKCVGCAGAGDDPCRWVCKQCAGSLQYGTLSVEE